MPVEPKLTLARLFSVIFAPAAVLMGVQRADVAPIADLLGTKLVLNEFVAFVKLTSEYRDVLSPRSYVLATYALTGFANFASIGIQLGGIGGMAPTRRGDLAALGARALFAGFLATLNQRLDGFVVSGAVIGGMGAWGHGRMWLDARAEARAYVRGVQFRVGPSFSLGVIA